MQIVIIILHTKQTKQRRRKPVTSIPRIFCYITTICMNCYCMNYICNKSSVVDPITLYLDPKAEFSPNYNPNPIRFSTVTTPYPKNWPKMF